MNRISCTSCSASFTARKNYYRHIRNYHPHDKIDYSYNSHIVCPQCEEKFSSILKLHEHLNKEHEIDLNFQNLTFDSEEEFQIWKCQIEEESSSNFIKHSGEKNCDEGKKSYFYCHRSGFFKPKEERKRNIKLSGSVKIGKSCPATIVLLKKQDETNSQLTVSYQSIHLGHNTETECGKLFLSHKDKNLLAASMRLGIPKKRILKDIASSSDSSKRLRLTTNQDLENIKRDFKIEDNVVLHSDDATSVRMHVDKLMQEDSNCILVFKPVGEISSFSGVDSSHFLLGYMNAAQTKMLELHGNNVVMIDSTHGMNHYGIQLTTLLVIDGDYEGFPVAFLYSSKTDKETFIIFFNEIKKRVPNLSPKFLMSDDYPAYVNAFRQVFGLNTSSLLCTWHVLRAWNQALCAKIKDSALREVIKNRLIEIQKETDQVTFEKSSDNFIKELLANENTSAFGNYFLKSYMTRPQQWAFCHRLNAGINTNMKLERWHYAIKHGEADGKVIKRLDKSLCILLNALQTKFINRIISLEKGKLSSKIQEMNNRHCRSKQLDPNSIIVMEEDKKWIVPSEKSTSKFLETYEIKRKEVCACSIRCSDCNVCIHEYTCTCPDYAIMFVICKHIHLVCMHYKKNDEDSDSLLVINENVNIMEKEILEDHLTVQKEKDVEKKRNEAVTLLSKMLQKCKSSSISYEELDVVITSLKDTNRKMMYLQNVETMKENSVNNCKRKIGKQKRFFDSKK